MTEETLEYKIQKYTYKLKHAKNRKIANHYQDKLQHYHKLNRMSMNGGGFGDDLKKKAEEVSKKLQHTAQNVFTNVSAQIDQQIKELNNDPKANALIEELNTLKTSGSKLAVDEINKQMGNITDKIANFMKAKGVTQQKGGFEEENNISGGKLILDKIHNDVCALEGNISGKPNCNEIQKSINEVKESIENLKGTASNDFSETLTDVLNKVIGQQ